MVNKQSLSLRGKNLDNKIAYRIIGVFIFVLIVFILLIPTCAPCRYQNRTELCMGSCVYAPMWKVFLFNLTGISLDYNEIPQILPKPY